MFQKSITKLNLYDFNKIYKRDVYWVKKKVGINKIDQYKYLKTYSKNKPPCGRPKILIPVTDI